MLRFHPLAPDAGEQPAFSPPERESTGAILAALLIDESGLIVLGWTATVLPDEAAALLGHAGGQGQWQGTSWRRAGDDAGHWFLGHLGFDNVAAVVSGGVHLLAADGKRAVSLPVIARIELASERLLRALADAKAPTAALLDFLRAARDKAAPEAAGRWDAFLRDYLRGLSHQSGFMEILGAPDCGGLLIQGWSFALAAGQRPLVVEGASVAIHEAVVATFPRADLIDEASGIVAYLKDAPAAAMHDLCRIYFEHGGEIRHLDLVDAPLRLEAAEAVLHLRTQLAHLEAEIPVLRRLKRVCRPRFDGANTLEQVAHPVRLAVDIVLDVPGEGVFLSGWLLDPRNLVRLVLLKSTANFYGRVHDAWVRRPRPDVSEGFSADPAFARWMSPGADLHGFLAFIPRAAPPAEGETLYVEIVLEDESCGFLPIESDRRPVERVAREILSAVRLDDPTLEALIGRHIGPAVSGALAVRPPEKSTVAVASFGIGGPTPAVSVIMPLTGDGADLDIHLAGWSTDPDFAAAEIVIVAPRLVGERIATRLKKQAEFYRLGGRLVLTSEPLDACEATEVGVAHARAETLLFLAENVFPRAPGWLKRLKDELGRHPGAGAISPTLLYEDLSIRFAGLSQVEAPGASADGMRRYAGYPHHWLTETEVTPVHALATECCLLTRECFQAIGGFSREFTDSAYKSLDFSRRLGAAGRPCLWQPAVDLFALDPDPRDGGEEYWVLPAREVDAWRFGRKWSLRPERSAPAGAGHDQRVS